MTFIHFNFQNLRIYDKNQAVREAERALQEWWKLDLRIQGSG